MSNPANLNVIMPGMGWAALPHYNSRPNAYMSALRQQLTQQTHAEQLIAHEHQDLQQGRNFVANAVKMMTSEKGLNVDEWA